MAEQLDPLIHQRTRLRLMTLLHTNRDAPFTWIQDQLELTPGNLDSHASRLADARYVEYGRKLTRDGFENRIRITGRGDEAYRAYRRALADLLETGDRPGGNAR